MTISLIGGRSPEPAPDEGDIGMVRTQGFFADGKRAFVKLLGLGVAAVCPVELGQALEVRHGQVRAIGTHGLFPDRELALMERPSFRITTLECIKHGEVTERPRHIGVVRTPRFFLDRERAFEKLLSFRKAELRLIKPSEAIEPRTHSRVVRAQCLLSDCERTLQERLGFSKAVLNLIEQGEAVERDTNMEVVGTLRFFGNYKRARQERFGLSVTALVAVEHAKVVEPARVLRMLLAVSALGQGKNCSANGIPSAYFPARWSCWTRASRASSSSG